MVQIGALPVLKDGLTVAPVEDRDAEALYGLVEACFSEYADEGVLLDRDGLDSDLASWATYLGKKGGAGWKAVNACGDLIACIGYTQAEDSLFELKRLYVAEPYRGTRLAVNLLAFVERCVLKAGGELLMLWSDSRFRRAHNFYRREGFAKLPTSRELNDLSNTVEYQFLKSL